VVDEGPLAVDLDHREPFPVLRLEVGIAADVDLLQLERHLGADVLDYAPRALAEVAPGRVVQDDSPQNLKRVRP
jgi:hypothetical protein